MVLQQEFSLGNKPKGGKEPMVTKSKKSEELKVAKSQNSGKEPRVAKSRTDGQ